MNYTLDFIALQSLFAGSVTNAAMANRDDGQRTLLLPFP